PDEEPGPPLQPVRGLDGEDRAVERADVIEGEDRRARQWNVLDPFDADAKEQPYERGDDPDADAPPPVQLTPVHARMLRRPPRLRTRSRIPRYDSRMRILRGRSVLDAGFA